MPKKHHSIGNTWSASERRQYHRKISRAICRATSNPDVPVDPAILDRISITKGIDRRDLEQRIIKRGFKVGDRKKRELNLDVEKIYDAILTERDPLVRVNHLNKLHTILLYKFKIRKIELKELADVETLVTLLKEGRNRKTNIELRFIQKLENLLVYLKSQLKIGDLNVKN